MRIDGGLSKSTTDTVLDETIGILSKNDPVFETTLRRLGEGNSLASVLRDYKTRTGYLVVSQEEAAKFKKYKCTKLVSDLIHSRKYSEKFTLQQYEVSGTRLYYEIELKKSKESDLVMKTIRSLRKNKDYYVQQIRGV